MEFHLAMRKIFIGTLCIITVVVATVCTTAAYALRYPDSSVAKFLQTMAQVGVASRPVGGYGPAVGHFFSSKSPAPTCPPTTCEGAVTCEVSTPCMTQSTVVANADPIVIPEEMGIEVKTQAVQEVTTLGQALVPVTSSTSLPGEMAYCEENCEVKDRCKSQPVQTLPMPKVEGTEETQEIKMPIIETEPTECREDVHRHHHYSGCPYSGQCNQCPGRSMTPTTPVVDPKPVVEPKPLTMPVAEEPSEKPTPTTKKKTSTKKKTKKVHTLKMPTEETTVHPDVDTMEYRLEDGSLSDYGPAPL
jgi:hypothetical protein